MLLMNFSFYFGAGWLLTTSAWWLGLAFLLIYTLFSAFLIGLAAIFGATAYLGQWTAFVAFMLGTVAFLASSCLGDMYPDLTETEIEFEITSATGTVLRS